MTLVRSKTTLKQVSRTLTLRCDAKQCEPRFLQMDQRFSSIKTIRLSSYLPEPFVKGKQPTYVEEPGDSEIAYIVSTLAVQPLRINPKDCRYAPKSFYDSVGIQRHLRNGDIVLTMDGGTSIGKAAVFNKMEFAASLDIPEEELFVTVDSHVAILRPQGISPLALAHLLASPLGQLQFQRAESGASGQTAVSEDDVRYFQFPEFNPEELEAAVASLKASLDGALELIRSADERKQAAWRSFETQLVGQP